MVQVRFAVELSSVKGVRTMVLYLSQHFWERGSPPTTD